MNLRLCLLIVCGLLPAALTAQCERNEYRVIISLAQQDLAARNYQLTINRLLDARDICPDEKDAVNALIKQAFEQIEGEKRAVEREKARADSALAVSEWQRQRADSILYFVAKERDRADSALAISERVLGQLYFYGDKFGLTLKNIGQDQNQNPIYRYGYIDREGNQVIPFEYEEAAPFNRANGFARVKKGGKKYLLDTTGVAYLLAERLADLRPETEALDLHESLPNRLPKNLGEFEQLKVIWAHWEFPAVLERLMSIDELPLGFFSKGTLQRLPASMGQLRQLQQLNLRDNKLATLPPEIGQLSQLQKLYLGGNQLSTLPPETGELGQLQEVDLSGNQLRSLPPEIGQLSQLQSLSLSENQLTTLPPEIGNLKKLRYLDLRGNPLPEAEQARIRALLPECSIEF